MAAEVKISELQPAAALAGNELVEVVQGGANRQTSVAAIAGLVPPATPSASGLMSAADKAKLDGVAPGATANASDAQLRDRASHTGTQPISSISGLQAALDAKADDSHTHLAAEVTDLNQRIYTQLKTTLQQGANVTLTPDDGAQRLTVASTGGGGSGGANWGEIGGLIGNQADLQAALAGKAAVSHAHNEATPGTSGFLSAADKTKLDGIAPGATNTPLSSDAPSGLGTAAAGVSASAARADHVHAHGNLGGGSLHSVATTGAAGFLSAADKAKLDGIAPGATANSPDATLLNRANHTGAQSISTVSGLQAALDGKADVGHSHAAATTGAAGFLSAADKAKLDGIAPGATANSPDATLLNRANHTGAQSISTVSGLQAALDAKAPSMITVESNANTTYQLTATDNGKVKVFTAAAAVTVTVPTGLGAGFSCTLVQGGSGAVTLQAGAGAAVSSLDGSLTTSGQNAAVSLLPLGADSYLALGALGSFVAAVYTAVKTIAVAGSNVTLTPNDGTNRLTIAAAGAGGVADGDKGDITVSASGATWTLDNNVVTNAKAADMATGTLKGRVSAGAGDPEDLTAAQVRTLLNVADGATANATDAQLRDRSTHTGTQAISTIAGLQAALDAKAPASLGLNSQTGTAYTLVLTDANTAVARNNAGANTTTVPPNSAVAFPVGTSIVIYQAGAGAASIAADTGVTIRKRANRNLTLAGQYAMATLIKIAADEWVCSGDLEAV